MGPRRILPRQMRRARGEVLEERRTKARNEPSSSIPTSPPHEAPTQVSPLPSRFASRVVVPGRKIDFDYFEENGFQFGHLINNQGWMNFCKLDIPYYPHLIKEFYSSLKLGVGSIEGSVKNVKIILNGPILGRILDIPSEGETPERLERRVDGLRCILERDNVVDLEEIRANQLSADMRVLHHVVGRIFLPKTGRFDFITERELAFMTYLIRGQSLNLPEIMIQTMREAAKKVKVYLPYGMALTLIFNEFGVDLDDEPSKVLMPTDTYTERSLCRMGFRKVEGVWIRRDLGQPQPQAQGEYDSPDSPPAAPGSPTAEPVSPPAPVEPDQTAPYWMDTLCQRMTESFSFQIRSELSCYGQRMDSMQTDIRGLQGDIRGVQDDIRGIQSDIRVMSERLSVLEQRSCSADTLDRLSDEIRALSDRIAALQQQSMVEPTEISDLAHQAARLRGQLELGISSVQETYQDMRDRHRDATLMFLNDLRHLTEQVEELTRREAVTPRPPPSQASSSRPPFRF